MTKVTPPFFCPKCGNEIGYTYDANTGCYTPEECRKPGVLKILLHLLNDAPPYMRRSFGSPGDGILCGPPFKIPS